jgi:hypothetical protein
MIMMENKIIFKYSVYMRMPLFFGKVDSDLSGYVVLFWNIVNYGKACAL